MVFAYVEIEEMLRGEVLSTLRASIGMNLSIVYFIICVGSERQRLMGWQRALHYVCWELFAGRLSIFRAPWLNVG